MSRYAIGVDLGGTKIEIGIVDEKGKIHEKIRLNTDVDQGAAFIENQIVHSIKMIFQKYPVSGIGIGVAGQIEAKTGVVTFAPNLKWHQVPLQSYIQKQLNVPVCIVNDVRAITLGEWLYGAGQGCQDLLCVFVGTGIGGGVVSGGHLLTGCSNACCEIGHMTIHFQGPMCTCGKRGCFESFAGGWGIAKRAQEAINNQASSILLDMVEGQIKNITAKTVIDAYHQKDPLAQNLMKEIEEALIVGLVNLVNIYNPCRLILGGGVIDGVPEIIEILDQGIKASALKASVQSLKVMNAQLGKEAGIVGCSAAIFNALN